MDAWFTLQGTRGTKNWLLIGIYILEEIYFKTVRYTYQSTCSCIVYTGGGGGGERERERERESESGGRRIEGEHTQFKHV